MAAASRRTKIYLATEVISMIQGSSPIDAKHTVRRTYPMMMIGPSPDHVKVLEHDEFLKLNGSYFISIRPGKKAGDPTVHDLRALQFSSEGKVHFIAWEALPQRVQVPNEPIAWIRMFPCTLPIKERKFQDLQSMEHVRPVKCHHFFDNLPH
ncbi:hypothetical protein ABVT39_016715 [Epinephelus coioides]